MTRLRQTEALNIHLIALRILDHVVIHLFRSSSYQVDQVELYHFQLRHYFDSLRFTEGRILSNDMALLVGIEQVLAAFIQDCRLASD